MTIRVALAKFNPGKVLVTQGVIDKMDPDYAFACLEQHLSGSWGLVGADDAAANDSALKSGARLLSVYPLPDEGDNFYIITEADRSATTIMLPEEY